MSVRKPLNGILSGLHVCIQPHFILICNRSSSDRRDVPRKKPVGADGILPLSHLIEENFWVMLQLVDC